MRRFVKVISCLGILSFLEAEGMLGASQYPTEGVVEHSRKSPIMAPVVVTGQFVMLPVADVATLCLISTEGVVYFGVPENLKTSTIKSLLEKSGCCELSSSSVSFKSSLSQAQLEGDTTMLMSRDVSLPMAVSSAIRFLTEHKTKIPTDEKSLFFFKSLLLLDKADKELIDKVDDELSGYDSYYDPDPYVESLRRIHEIGIYEYAKLFTEAGFNDIQLVLEFSKIARTHNPDCKRDFKEVLNSLKMITEIVKESGENVALLRKFKLLYERIGVE